MLSLKRLAGRTREPFEADAKEATTAFLEKRAPVFRARQTLNRLYFRASGIAVGVVDRTGPMGDLRASRRLTMRFSRDRSLPFPVMTRTNHFYGTKTRGYASSCRKMARRLQFVTINGRKKLAIGGKISNYIPQSHLGRVAAPGTH